MHYIFLFSEAMYEQVWIVMGKVETLWYCPEEGSRKTHYIGTEKIVCNNAHIHAGQQHIIVNIIPKKSWTRTQKKNFYARESLGFYYL